MLTLRKILLIALIGAMPLNYVSADQSRQIVRVLGCNDPEKIHVTRERAYFCLDYLGILEDIILLITFVDFNPQNETYKQHLLGTTIPSAFDGKPMMHVLIEKNLGFERQMIVLYHEITHVKQFIRKELIQHANEHITWKGKDYYRILETDYAQRAWEKEALTFQDKIHTAFEARLKEQKISLVQNSSY
ncbi:MAG: hypothetical protein NW226_19165 [Microscillaceae bacterium]|nr:hypothetical protein [Microscillaceae bacterium]